MKILFFILISLIMISCVNTDVNLERSSRQQEQESYIKEYYQHQLNSDDTRY